MIEDETAPVFEPSVWDYVKLLAWDALVIGGVCWVVSLSGCSAYVPRVLTSQEERARIAEDMAACTDRILIDAMIREFEAKRTGPLARALADDDAGVAP